MRVHQTRQKNPSNGIQVEFLKYRSDRSGKSFRMTGCTMGVVTVPPPLCNRGGTVRYDPVLADRSVKNRFCPERPYGKMHNSLVAQEPEI